MSIVLMTDLRSEVTSAKLKRVGILGVQENDARTKIHSSPGTYFDGLGQLLILRECCWRCTENRKIPLLSK